MCVRNLSVDIVVLYLCLMGKSYSLKHFCFLNITGNEMRVQENEKVQLKFQLLDDCNKSSQPMREQKDITIGEKSGVFCTITDTTEQCYGNPSTSCWCEYNSNGYLTGVYVFSNSFNRNDGGLWTWSATSFAKDKRFTFSVTYPAFIKTMTLEPTTPQRTVEQQPFKPGKSLLIRCDWQNGNPSTEALLVSNKNVTVQRASTSGPFRHRIPSVRCDDAGPWICMAPGSDLNKTQQLFVDCPTQLRDTERVKEKNGDGSVCKIRIHSEVTRFAACQLRQLSTSPNTSRCSSLNATWQGVPPEHVLQMPCPAVVTSHPDMMWQLELFSEVGKQLLDFNFSSKGPQLEESKPVTTPTSTAIVETTTIWEQVTSATSISPSAINFSPVNISVVASLVFLAFITLLLQNRRCRKSAPPTLPQQPIQQQPQQQQPQQQPPQQREVRPGGRTPSNHKPALPEGVITGHLLSPNVYDLINEDLVGVENGRQQSAIDPQPSTSQGVYGEAYEEARPKPCGPRTGYLHPIPAKEDVFADLTGQRQSPRRPASRPRSVPVPRSNMLYFWRR